MVKGSSLVCVLLSLVLVPVLCFAQSSDEAGSQSLLSAFMSYTDLRVHSIQQSLEILASTTEVGSGNWETMKGLLGGYQKSGEGLIVWVVLPDGSYYTVDKGLMDAKLSDRDYFPDLMAGREIIGALVVSKSTGQRSAVIAVPVKDGDKVIGGAGASLFLDVLADQIGSTLALPPGVGFFALAPSGLTALHTKTDRHFLDPRELGSDSLKKAANEMLSTALGEVTYQYEGATRTAFYRTSPLTGWKFAITVSNKKD